jgi:hypothetical protein
MNPDNQFRLIANPLRLNQKVLQKPKDNTNDVLMKYLKLRYKMYIPSKLLSDINVDIDDKINDYLIKKTSHDLIEKCIKNVLEKFENQMD